MHLELLTRSAAQTRACGERLGRAARPGDVLLLDGELGAGKTVLVQGLAAGLGCAEAVVSPTFVLVRQLQGRLDLVHADLYRLDPGGDVSALGLDELGAGGLLAVEWASNAGAGLPRGATLGVFAEGERTTRKLVFAEAPSHLRSVFLR